MENFFLAAERADQSSRRKLSDFAQWIGLLVRVRYTNAIAD
jgi:hypothetical protein